MNKNTPYVKELDKDGNILNPIKDKYINSFPNRQQRNSEFKKTRFFGNGKNHPLSIVKNAKYLKTRQIVAIYDIKKPKTDNFMDLTEYKSKRKQIGIKTIEHYVLQ